MLVWIYLSLVGIPFHPPSKGMAWKHLTLSFQWTHSKELAQQRKTLHPFACSGSCQPSSWTQELPLYYRGSYCSAVHVSPPHLWQKWIDSPTTQPPQSSRKIPSAHHSSLLAPGLQGTGSRLREYPCISAMLQSIILTDGAVAPSCSQHLLCTSQGILICLSGKHWGHHVYGDVLQCPCLGPVMKL